MNYASLLETVGLVAIGVVLGAITTATRTVMLSEKSFVGITVTLDTLVQARDAIMIAGLVVFTVSMFGAVAIELQGES